MDPLPDDAERDAVLQDVCSLFRERGDVNAVRDAGRTIGDLQVAGEARHKQMLESIKGARRAPSSPAREGMRSAAAAVGGCSVTARGSDRRESHRPASRSGPIPWGLVQRSLALPSSPNIPSSDARVDRLVAQS